MQNILLVYRLYSSAQVRMGCTEVLVEATRCDCADIRTRAQARSRYHCNKLRPLVPAVMNPCITGRHTHSRQHLRGRKRADHMEQGPIWEAEGQEISHLTLPCVSQMNPVHTLTLHFS
jgi:hypothetical protein